MFSPLHRSESQSPFVHPGGRNFPGSFQERRSRGPTFTVPQKRTWAWHACFAPWCFDPSQKTRAVKCCGCWQRYHPTSRAWDQALQVPASQYRTLQRDQDLAAHIHTASSDPLYSLHIPLSCASFLFEVRGVNTEADLAPFLWGRTDRSTMLYIFITQQDCAPYTISYVK